MPLSGKIEVKQLDMELNGGCNYKCPMCPQADGREKDFLKKLPLDVFKKVVDDAMQYGLDTVSLHGSGEPTLNRDMPDFVRYVKDRGLRCVSFTNGFRLDADMSQRLIEAGLDVLRISCIGYDRSSYAHWMSQDAFQRVRDNVKAFVDLNAELDGCSEVHLYHLVSDLKHQDEEIAAYRRNWVEYTGGFSEIWLMHNWAGSDNVEIGYHRHAMIATHDDRRSCGRPFSPLLQVRAGGLDGHYAAVVACCMVLGKDSTAVLGHLDDQTIAEVVGGAPYEELRAAHSEKRFDDIAYCAGCDQLYDMPESLVWTNIPGREYGQSKIVTGMDHRTFSNAAAE
jgi:hypothetical protein